MHSFECGAALGKGALGSHWVTGMPLDPAEHTAQLWLPWQEAMARTFSPTNREAIGQLPRRVLGHTERA